MNDAVPRVCGATMMLSLMPLAPNPNTINGLNAVYSTQVADAKIEYSAKGYIDEAQNMGWLQRFFLNVAPW